MVAPFPMMARMLWGLRIREGGYNGHGRWNWTWTATNWLVSLSDTRCAVAFRRLLLMPI